MLKYSGKKFFIFIFILVFISQFRNYTCASYEVVKARTVDNENIVEKQEAPVIPTFNDPELPNFSVEDSVGYKIEQKARNFFNKRKKKNSAVEDEIPNEDIKNPNKTDVTTAVETVSDKNKFQINADKITYDDTEGNVYAKGNVEIIAKSQGVTLKADEAVLDKASQTIKLHKNVKIIKDGVEMKGEFMLVDLNEQNILMDDPVIEAYSFTVRAQEGYLIANDIQMINGNLKSNKKTQYPLVSAGFAKIEPRGALGLYEDLKNDMSALNPPKKQVYTINSKEIVITSYKDHDSILLKGSNVLYNNHKIIHNSDIEIISDKQNQVIETNMPEAGTMRNFGTYFGYGLVYKLPKGQTLKLMPAIIYQDGMGVGVIGRHQSKNGTVEGGWGTSSSNLVVRGKYRLSDSLSLKYTRNSYISEGFMGARRPGYGAQLEYVKSYGVSDLGITFTNGVYAGIFSDYQKHDQEHAYATTRFRYNAEMYKTLLSYENKEQDLSISLNGLAQGSATVYGSGQTSGVVRVGPFVTTKLKSWESSIGYILAGIHGDSPFVFDKYRYGKSSIVLNEKFNITNKFALGFRATVTPSKDNYERDLLTESRLYLMFGPQDLKVALSYDFVRDVAHADFMFLVGSDSAKINFEKLITQGADRSQEKRDFYKHSKRIKIEDNENI